MISPSDIAIIFFLCFLEGILSIDNAIVLALMVRHLPEKQQKKALSYGLVGAFFFRLICLAIATQLIHWQWLKIIGGAYLVYLAIKSHLHRKTGKRRALISNPPHGFWKTVFTVEMMDLLFAVDSILAAVAVSPKFWVVFTGGIAGVVLVRIAATHLVRIIKRFPGLEASAFYMILIIGIKLTIEGAKLPMQFDHASDPGFLVFWGLMALSLTVGLLRTDRAKA